MKYVAGKNLFKDYAKKHESLIYQYRKGDLSKREYISESHKLLIQFEAKPFVYVDSFDKAVFNYQYYNTMAKYSHMIAEKLFANEKHKELSRSYITRKDKYYRKKDQMIWKAVHLENFIGVEAYYIKVTSRFLKNTLFEVIFDQHPMIVFHSTGVWLKERLIDEKVFVQGLRESIIDQYVNQTY